MAKKALRSKKWPRLTMSSLVVRVASRGGGMGISWLGSAFRREF
jgi:hypothetical protein